MGDKLTAFRRERERLNEKVLQRGPLGMKRFFALDERTYDAGALDARTKELLGLASSTVLRCDDCITYHPVRCAEEGIPDDEIMEALNVALVVGGSIVIPHVRRSNVSRWTRAAPARPSSAGRPLPGSPPPALSRP